MSVTNANFTMRQLLEAGVHFGHHRRRWDPKMAPYLYGVRNDIHIIDLTKTVPLLTEALQAIRSVVSEGGRLLFVGTKKQASEKIAESAKKCGQYYVNHRWLGGMLSNWKTISNSIKHFRCPFWVIKYFCCLLSLAPLNFIYRANIFTITLIKNITCTFYFY